MAIKNDSLGNLRLLNVGLSSHVNDWTYFNVESPFSRLYLVVKGEAIVNIYGSDHRLLPGNIYLIPPFTSHSNRCTGSFSHYYLHVYEDIVSGESIFEQLVFPFQLPSHHFDITLFETLCEHNEQMKLKSKDPKVYDNNSSLIKYMRRNRERPLADKLESSGIISFLMSRFVREAIPRFNIHDPRITKALRIINNDLSATPSIETLAAEACLCTDHFIRLFREKTGMTPLHYINQKKIMKAQFFLATSDMSIKEIARITGYHDVPYFYRVFRRFTLQSPLQYRESFNKI